jgi:hypothetical protein
MRALGIKGRGLDRTVSSGTHDGEEVAGFRLDHGTVQRDEIALIRRSALQIPPARLESDTSCLLGRLVKLRDWRGLQQFQERVAGKTSLPENVAQRTLRYIARMKRNDRSPRGIILVPQEMVTAFDAIDDETSTL